MFKRSLVGLFVGLCVIGLGSRWAGAEEAGAFWEKTKVSGTVDTSYLYNINRPARGTLVPARQFDVLSNSFNVNMVELAVETQPAEWATARFDLDYGSDAVAGVVHYGNVQQAYLKVAADSGLSLTMGKFVTMHGAEVIESGANLNFSRSALFTNMIPLTHAGLKLDYPINDDWTGMLALVNGWNTVVDNNAMKSLQLGLAGKLNDQWSTSIGGMLGPETADVDKKLTYLIDAIINFDPSETWHFGLNADYTADNNNVNTTKRWGAALYGHYRAEAPWGATVRLEYLKVDANNRAIAGGALPATGLGANGKGYEGTLTLHHYATDGLETRLEIRHDQADTAVFPGKPGSAAKKYQDTAALEMVYTF